MPRKSRCPRLAVPKSASGKLLSDASPRFRVDDATRKQSPYPIAALSEMKKSTFRTGFSERVSVD
jgi:hypothetical protein